jgi:hypothetical protein
MELLKTPKKAKLIKGIEHQGIGGKEIIIEREGTLNEVLEANLNEMTIAMSNFVGRRIGLMSNGDRNTKIYYGHVGLYGYFVAEDEIDGAMTDYE